MGGAGFSNCGGIQWLPRIDYQLAVLGYVGAAAFISTTASAQNADAAVPAKDGEEIEEVVVTGFRASLQNSVAAKRDNIAFSDSIFAEDIGKFPDLNLAESLQRIPGVQIARDFTGEGTSVAVRGLGRDFTQITLNGAPVETASDSNIDGVSQGRGIDLVLFPTELFRQLTVSKTPTAQSDRRRGRREHRPAHRAAVRRQGLPRQLQRQGQLPGIGRRLEPASRRSTSAIPGIRAWASSASSAASPIRIASTAPMASTPSASRRWRLGNSLPVSRTDPLCNSFVTPNNDTGYGNQAQAWPTTVPAGYNFGANGADDGNPATPIR